MNLEEGFSPGRPLRHDNSIQDAAGLSSSASLWSRNNLASSSANHETTHARVNYVTPYAQHPAGSLRTFHGFHDSGKDTETPLSGQVLEQTSMTHHGQAFHRLNIFAERPVYYEAWSRQAVAERPASFFSPEANWQGHVNALYTNPYASNTYPNASLSASSMPGNFTRTATRLAPMPYDVPERFPSEHPRYVGAYDPITYPNGDHLQAPSSSLPRRRSAPDRATAPAMRQLATQITSSEARHASWTSEHSQPIAHTTSNPVPSASQTGILLDGYRCPDCNRVLQDERGLKRHQLTHSKNFALSHICEECEAAFQFEKDLIRHSLTHNEGPEVRKYKCPSRTCVYFWKGFKRKDHFTRHVRAQHGMDPTPYLAQYE